eukprot:5452254-Pyramimonas_sp.AAC.1
MHGPWKAMPTLFERGPASERVRAQRLLAAGTHQLSSSRAGYTAAAGGGGAMEISSEQRNCRLFH